jgi:hypothetical protein
MSLKNFHEKIDTIDSSQKDGMLGASQETSLEDLENQASQSIENVKGNLGSLLTDEDEIEMREDIGQLFNNREQAIRDLDSITDQEVSVLLTKLYDDLRSYEEFKVASLEIDLNSDDSLELMSNVDKRITRIDFQHMSGQGLATWLSADEVFDPSVNFTVAVLENADLTALGLTLLSGDKYLSNTGRNVQVVVLSPYDNFSAYSRDDRVTFADGDTMHSSDYRKSDLKAVEKIAEDLDMDLEVNDDIYIEGGNLRSTNNILYLGIDSVLKTIEINDEVETKEQAIKLYEEKFKKKVVPIGEFGVEKQPDSLFHIDLFLTPLSDNEVMVAQLPEDHEHYEYLKQVVEELHRKMPHIKINRLEAPMFNGAIISYNNMLVENTTLPDGTSERTIYLPNYVFSGYEQSIKDSMHRLDTKFIPDAKELAEEYPDDPSLQEDLARVQAKRAVYISELEEVSQIDEVAFNKKSSEQITTFMSDDPSIKTVIKPVNVDIRNLTAWKGNGGSLNCLTNEFRSQ